MQLLIPELCKRGYQIELLKVRRHGPNLNFEHPNFTVIDTGTRHTLLALRFVYRYLKRSEPYVLLADKDRCNRVALLAKILSNTATRVVVSSGTIMSENLKRRPLLDVWQHRLSINYLYPRAYAIITPSCDAADDLAAISTLSRHQITVVPLPVITPAVLAKAEVASSHPWLTQKTAPVLIAVGELSPRKDQTTLIQAFARARKQCRMKLLIVGKGKDLKKLQQLARQLNVADDINFCGFQSNHYNLMKLSDLFIHTATFEGFGMVMTEALALGTRVVAVDCPGGPHEILDNGRLGKLCPAGDANRLAQAILTVLDTADTNQQQRIESTRPYTIEASATAYLKAMGITAACKKTTTNRLQNLK